MPNRNRLPLNAIKRLSIKSRLVLAAIVWLTAMILAAGVTIPTQVYNYMVDDTRSQLSIFMDEVAAQLEVDNTGHLSLTAQLSDPRFNRPYSGLYWSASTEASLERSRSLWDKKIEYKGLDKDAYGARGEKLITLEKALYLPDYDGSIHIIIGIDEEPIKNTLQTLIGQLWLILGLLFAGVLTVILLQIAWSLSPLTKLQKELAELKSGNKKSLEETYPKEISPLIFDLNALLFHYQELLERARNHAGNLSHALKTPLSVLKNEVQTLEPEAQSRLRAPINQIQDHIDYHLGRARMAGSMNILSVKSNPADRVDAISMAFDKVYASRSITLINELDSELNVAVEQTDLDEMLGNLLENGYKWANSMIRVHSSQDKENIHIIIEDDGPGIPKEKLSQVIKRGVRLDETTPGSGLGLNIVSEMAHSYRGQLTLDTSALGGLKASLVLHLSRT
ncbi:TPA: GHKL domain-containing protein [Vibrio alginolyticus]|uniref:ATP-binding protein n=1 Tax=Vibrio TaxID=662 RepID=UPI002556647D|nr:MULTISPECIES: ATP-binding protein [unclassified Vibrio]EJL6743538.1 GHKL domain-containing protein [Vibrio alginolyticus]MDK9729622.1 GHKL domain-containing protein [Vibrio sp. D415a]MDK9744820.1 GHKL domain-containing protein [Vibrio sp. D409a]MDK9768512.1 GHKL domain-containing protein [Vibrio sp. D417a]MDK9788459.1 GHKL domain-containing protein [Vibrio sp. D421a]